MIAEHVSLHEAKQNLDRLFNNEDWSGFVSYYKSVKARLVPSAQLYISREIGSRWKHQRILLLLTQE